MTPVLTLSRVAACEPLGPYVQVQLERTFEPGEPGQFHMLRALAHDSFLARPLSAVAFDDAGVTFLCQPRGPALAALASVGAEVEVLGPFGRGFDSAAAGPAPLLVGGGFGAALLAPLSRSLPAAVLLAAFRDGDAARAAELVPAAEREIALPPANVLDLLGAAARGRLERLRRRARRPRARRRRPPARRRACPARSRSRRPWRAATAPATAARCASAGELVRLCVEGPVVAGERLAAA